MSVAQAVYYPPPPGTLLTWRYQFDSESFTRVSEIVASGDDFVIYDPDLSAAEGAASKYVVEFSGLHVQSCNDRLPSEDDRRALKSMWPLIPGASATVTAGGVDNQYTVIQEEEVGLIDREAGSTMAMRVVGRFGDAYMHVLVSREYSIPVAVNWSAGGSAQVLEIVESQGSAPDRDTLGKLGRCTELLQ